MNLTEDLDLKLKNLERLISSEGSKKVRKVMREFKKGKLNIGGSKKKVKNRKQAIAIALSEAGISKKTGENNVKTTPCRKKRKRST